LSDPFAYCAAVGTIDAPDGRYAGPPVPESVARGLKVALKEPADAPSSFFLQGTVWRCMEGKVYACNQGANIPCLDKADTNRSPNPDMIQYCRANPTSEFIPRAYIRRSTTYGWRCRNGTAEVAGVVAHPDQRGFVAEYWVEVSPN
jgi:hypothetical protein